jgi:hypothetical protein
VLIPAVLLRVDAELGYRWQVWFNDSFDYIQNTVHFSLDPTRPSGYSIWLKILEPFHTYALVTILQHLMGLAVAVMVYALARHRFGAPAWAATLATVPVLYDGFEIQLEHLILADIPFLFVLTLAVTLLLWSKEKPSLRRCVLIGVLLGISDLLRSVSLPLLLVIAVYMIIQRVKWRRIIAMGVVCALPVIAYAGVFDLEHGQFAMSDSTGVFLYSRTMTFAECSKMSLARTSPERLLCTKTPPDERPIAQAYIWTSYGYTQQPGGPQILYHNPLAGFGGSKFAPLTNKLAEKFAIAAIEAQPLSYARTVFDDTWKAFGFEREVFPNPATYDEYVFSRDPLGIPSYNLTTHYGKYKSYAAVYVEGNPYTHVVQPFAAIMETYEKHIYLPGTIYGLILLLGAGGIIMGWRRWGGEALLPWTISLALIVIPAATAEFDYRYVLPAVPFACLAAVMAFAPDTAGGRWVRMIAEGVRREPVPAAAPVSAGAPAPSAPAAPAPSGESSNGAVANGVAANGVAVNGSGSAGGPASGPVNGSSSGTGHGSAESGDDDRDLAPDGV